MPQIETVCNFIGYEEKIASYTVIAKWCITMFKYCLNVDLSDRLTVVKENTKTFVISSYWYIEVLHIAVALMLSWLEDGV